MKLAILGGGGARVPLLVHGLTQSDLPIDEIALYDTDQERIATLGRVAAQMSGRARVTVADTSAACVTGASFVFISIRVGGIATRAHDEAIALSHGVLGQETVGPVGFAMALRTVPEVVRYADEVARLAPDAWVVNFTNPVGIVTQAVRQATSARILGICDTPTELFVEAAQTLRLDPAACSFDYVGLNHLGWLREILHHGEPQLAKLMSRPDLLAKVYRAPLFPADFLVDLGMLPTEYLYFYYRAQDAVANLQRAGQTRGQAIARLNDALLRDLRAPGADVVRVYEDYLAARNAGYMQTESGGTAPAHASPWAELTGYDKIALSVVRAIHFDQGIVVPLNVGNRGNLAGLDADDVIEAPCVVGLNGARALHVGAPPDRARDLIVRVKDYERATVAAARSGSMDDAQKALALHPLVGTRELARTLLDEMKPFG